MSSQKILNRRFARHYAEMVVAMVLGMIVLGIPSGWALAALDSSWTQLRDDAPAAMLGLMTFTMTAPMSAWMYRVGHAWRRNAEMAASMILPTLGAIGLLAAGVVEDTGALIVIQHVAMLAGMFVAMALRAEEYSGHRHHEPVAA